MTFYRSLFQGRIFLATLQTNAISVMRRYLIDFVRKPICYYILQISIIVSLFDLYLMARITPRKMLLDRYLIYSLISQTKRHFKNKYNTQILTYIVYQVGKFSVNVTTKQPSQTSHFGLRQLQLQSSSPYPATLSNKNVLADVKIGDKQTINIRDGISATPYLLSANNTHMAINIYFSKPSHIIKLGITYVIFSNNVDAFRNNAVYHYTFMINQTIFSIQTYSTNLALPTTINMTGGATVVMLLSIIYVYPFDPSNANIDFIDCRSHLRVQ